MKMVDERKRLYCSIFGDKRIIVKVSAKRNKKYDYDTREDFLTKVVNDSRIREAINVLKYLKESYDGNMLTLKIR